jgi:predicted ABC-type transport system involved in lysophospholipase L1 biosynthesis ATPase subunit
MVTHDPHAAERARRVLHLEKGVLNGARVTEGAAGAAV